MYCNQCGKKIDDDSKFCPYCRENIKKEKNNDELEPNEKISETETSKKPIIKCGNCNYIGEGESARRIIFTVLAWLCVAFAPLITIIYFLATAKYRCPKCHSTFLGVKNSKGDFVGQKGRKSRVVLIVVVIIIGIAIIGILASIILASLNSARVQSRDARRIADIKQIQLALELYYDSYVGYPFYLSYLETPKDPLTSKDYGYKQVSGNSETQYYVQKGTNVRSCPSLSCEIIAQVPSYSRVELSVYNSDWYKWNFTFEDTPYKEEIGYMSSSVVEKIISKDTGYHLWAELENYNTVLNDDADFDSGWPEGIDGSKESCLSETNNDCVYDVTPYF